MEGSEGCRGRWWQAIELDSGATDGRERGMAQQSDETGCLEINTESRGEAFKSGSAPNFILASPSPGFLGVHLLRPTRPFPNFIDDRLQLIDSPPPCRLSSSASLAHLSKFVGLGGHRGHGRRAHNDRRLCRLRHDMSIFSQWEWVSRSPAAH